MVWAMIIAVGVYISCSSPNGPDLARKRAVNKPMITGGNDIKVYNNRETICLPLKSLMPSNIPSGIPIRVAYRVDEKVIKQGSANNDRN